MFTFSSYIIGDLILDVYTRDEHLAHILSNWCLYYHHYWCLHYHHYWCLHYHLVMIHHDVQHRPLVTLETAPQTQRTKGSTSKCPWGSGNMSLYLKKKTCWTFWRSALLTFVNHYSFNTTSVFETGTARKWMCQVGYTPSIDANCGEKCWTSTKMNLEA